MKGKERGRERCGRGSGKGTEEDCSRTGGRQANGKLFPTKSYTYYPLNGDELHPDCQS